MLARSIKTVGPVALVLLAHACAAESPRNNTSPPVVTIIVTDYGYEAPETVQAGLTAFHIVNHGEQPHTATIVRLEAGRTLAEYIEAYGEANRTRGARPDWATFLGGSAAFRQHDEGKVTIELEPGNYAWVCFVPGPDGVAHLLKHKQAQAFVVQPRSEDATAPGPLEPTVSLQMFDYTYQISAPIRSGKHMIRVENMGVEPHHVLLFKLGAQKTAADFQSWMRSEMQGDGPATFVGAMAELSKATGAYFEAELSTGEYALVCLVAGRDEVPHFEKGMIHYVRVE